MRVLILLKHGLMVVLALFSGLHSLSAGQYLVRANTVYGGALPRKNLAVRTAIAVLAKRSFVLFANHLFPMHQPYVCSPHDQMTVVAPYEVKVA